MITRLPFATLLSGGWFYVGPPYLYLTIDPVISHLGPFAIRWYGVIFPQFNIVVECGMAVFLN